MRSLSLSPLFTLLARFQVRRPWMVVAITLLTLIPAGWGSYVLFSDLRTSFSELLPDNKPSVIESRRVAERMGGTATLTVVAEADSAAHLKTFVDELSPQIQTLGSEWVTSVDTGTRAITSFLEANKHLYASLEDIERLHDEVEERWDYEVGRETGTSLGLDDDPPKPITAERIRNKLDEKLSEATTKVSRGIDGYYIGEDEHGLLAAILVRTPLATASPEAFELSEHIRTLADQTPTRKAHPEIQIYFTGNIITSAEQQATIQSDLAQVGATGVFLVLLVVYVFFLRIRMLAAMGCTILVGCTWAFGVAELTVGHLNTATMFLISIIAGNGINFGIIFMARYLEARREGALEGISAATLGRQITRAIEISHLETYKATLAAAFAAGVAYASLAATNFHGFKHFGIIAGAGMLLCWLATYWLLPAVLVLSERVSPMFLGEGGWRLRMRGVYGMPFAFLTRRFPRTLAVAGLGAGVLCTFLSVRYLADGPMEYNLKNVTNERGTPTSAARLSVRVDKIVGRMGQDGYAILTERVDQVEPLVQELKRRRDAASENEKPFSNVVSIYDVLPDHQEEKLELLSSTQRLLEKAQARGFIDAETWAEVEPHIPASLAPIGIADLPEPVARPFTETDGTRGRAVYIAPAENGSVYDARYLMRWAEGFRRVELPNGDVILGTGNPVIFSDMLDNIGEDAPLATGLSLTGTLLIVLIAFRGRRRAWLALGGLALGVIYLVGILAIEDIRLNFLNFVAIPIGIGVGADYVINLLKRLELTGDKHIKEVLIDTGGAIVLCSLTTTLGYAALMLSINRAVASFGLAAALGELTTLAAAMLVIPALIFWKLRQSASRKPNSQSIPASGAPSPEAVDRTRSSQSAPEHGHPEPSV